MAAEVVFTLTGPDRVGIVEEVTEIVLGMHGNVETSRMARLGGEFAIIMLVTLPAEQVDRFGLAFETLTRQGYRVTTGQADLSAAESHAGWLPYRIEVHGADHEGIVHEIAHGLSQRGINIESMDTGTRAASVSGTPLFFMSALVLVPPDLPEADWIAELDEAAHLANVDVAVAKVETE